MYTHQNSVSAPRRKSWFLETIFLASIFALLIFGASAITRCRYSLGQCWELENFEGKKEAILNTSLVACAHCLSRFYGKCGFFWRHETIEEILFAMIADSAWFPNPRFG